MGPNNDYYSKKKYKNLYCIRNNADEMNYYEFTFLENIKIGDDRNTYLLKKVCGKNLLFLNMM